MFLLDSLMISGLQWTLKTVVAAAEAEMNDDSALRERLMEAELQREMGEISDEQFAAREADLLQAIREIKERREGGSGAFGFASGQPIEADGQGSFQVEAELAGDFYGEPDRSDRLAGSHPPSPSTRSHRPDRPRSSRRSRSSRSSRAK